jgi:hypothetical protein
MGGACHLQVVRADLGILPLAVDPAKRQSVLFVLHAFSRR